MEWRYKGPPRARGPGRSRPTVGPRPGGDPAEGPGVRSVVPLALLSRSPPAAFKAPPSLLARSSLVGPVGAGGLWLAGPRPPRSFVAPRSSRAPPLGSREMSVRFRRTGGDYGN